MIVSFSRSAGLILVAMLSFCGGCVGLIAGYVYRLPSQRPHIEIVEYPLPHHVPKYEGGISLRLAMVQDVLHERYSRHGSAYYQERNRLVRQELANGKQRRDEAYLALFDDLGSGLDAVKRVDEAVTVLRDKLRLQEEIGQKELQLYTTYANLGTFLIHGSAHPALSGDASARDRLREGLSMIEKSIEVNPQAHFGREVWQAVTVKYLLAVSKNAKLLLRYDLVGDRLDEEIDPSERRCFTQEYGLFGANRDAAAYLRGNLEEMHFNKESLRKLYITRVGADPDWNLAVADSDLEPVPFDEPVLGIIGMWRLGGGANPHFALALGEIMLRVGQRYVAWCAYERAIGMADRVWPAADVQRAFVDHCRGRQQRIEQQLSPQETKELRPRHEAELAYGRRYQKDYQKYEAERIRAGESLNDAHFYNDFEAAHEPIASSVGEEEKYVAETREVMPFLNGPIAVFAAGFGACLAACLIRLVGRR